MDAISWKEQILKIEKKVQKKQIDKLHCWVFNHPRVLNSPLKIYHINIRDHGTGEVIKTKKSLTKTPIR